MKHLELSKSAWKKEHRMKPIDENVYVRELQNSYKKTYKIYNYDQVKPMKKYTKKPMTEKQKMAVVKMHEGLEKKKIKDVLLELHENREACKRISQNLIGEDVVVFDTETTGLHNPHILQITAISSKTKEVLVDTYVNTKAEIEEGAYNVHGISKEDICNAPTMLDVYNDLIAKLNGRKLTSYNTSFDFTALECSLKEHDKKLDKSILSMHCIMEISAWYHLRREDNYKDRIALHKSVMLSDDVVFKGEPHTSYADCMVAVDLLHYYTNYDFDRELEKEINYYFDE